MTDRYVRTSFRVPGDRPLTAADAAAMIGHQVTASTLGVVVADGAVCDCTVVDDGAALWVTVEAGGRACAACGHVYPPEEAETELWPAKNFQQQQAATPPAAWALVYRDLPSWALVCATLAICQLRRAGRQRGPDPLPAE